MRTKTLLPILLFITFSLPLFAATMEEAMDEAARYLTGTGVRIQSSHQFVLDVVNFRSGKKDSRAQKIEAELYLALEKHFPDYKLILLAESRSGVSSRSAVLVKATYEPMGDQTILRLQAVKGLTNGEILAQKAVMFDSKIQRRRTLVAILDLEAQDLNKKQRKAFSEVFRSQIIQKDVFEVASSADIDKMNPDAIQQKLNCTRDECATIIGEQLGVDRVISSNVFQLTAKSWILSGKMIDIKDGSIVTSATVNHRGDLSTFSDTLGQLAGKLTGKLAPAAPAPTARRAPRKADRFGQLFISSSPKRADIYLDGRKLNQKTDALLKQVPVGNRKIELRKDGKGAERTVFVREGEVNRTSIHLTTLQAKVTVSSRPFDASIYLDGVFRGKTPLTLTTTAGKHRLEVKKDGHLDFSQRLDLDPSRTNQVEAVLEESFVIQVRFSPKDAHVALNGKALGKGDYKLSPPADQGLAEVKVPAGVHRISVGHEGAVRKEEKEVVVRPRQSRYEIEFKELAMSTEWLKKKRIAGIKAKRTALAALPVLAGLFTFYSVNEAQAAANDQSAAESKLKKATRYNEAMGYESEADKANQVVKKQNQNILYGSLATAALIGVAVWQWPELEEGKQTGWAPSATVEGGIGLAYRVRW